MRRGSCARSNDKLRESRRQSRLAKPSASNLDPYQNGTIAALNDRNQAGTVLWSSSSIVAGLLNAAVASSAVAGSRSLLSAVISEEQISGYSSAHSPPGDVAKCSCRSNPAAVLCSQGCSTAQLSSSSASACSWFVVRGPWSLCCPYTSRLTLTWVSLPDIFSVDLRR